MPTDLNYKKCRNILLPLGYVEIFKNHPCSEVREYHWIKDGVRVCCVWGKCTTLYCYFHIDIARGLTPTSLRTGNFNVDTVDYEYVNNDIRHMAETLKLLK